MMRFAKIIIVRLFRLDFRESLLVFREIRKFLAYETDDAWEINVKRQLPLKIKAAIAMGISFTKNPIAFLLIPAAIGSILANVLYSLLQFASK